MEISHQGLRFDLLREHDHHLLASLLPPHHPRREPRLQGRRGAVPRGPAVRFRWLLYVRDGLARRSVPFAWPNHHSEHDYVSHRLANSRLAPESKHPLPRRVLRHGRRQLERPVRYGVPGEQHPRPVEARLLQRHARGLWRYRRDCRRLGL